HGTAHRRHPRGWQGAGGAGRHPRIAAGPSPRRPARVPLHRALHAQGRALRSRAGAAHAGARASRRVLQSVMTALLESIALKKHFALRGRSRLHAVDEVSFTIDEGESVGLVGEAGCGKSTLARLITRTLDPTDGDLIFRGRNIGFIPARVFAATPF